MDESLDATFEAVRASHLRMQLPGVVEGTSWGTQALKAKGKLLVRVREPDVLVLLVDPGIKEFLKDAQPEVYFETDHYRGSSYILVRVSAIAPEELDDRLEQAWRQYATQKMLREYESRT